ncbi:PLP-dependent aminotransferase family protein [Shewanella waksmanii]|uniref:aminotransferase-like domain-containing protein n=1 Tax=Shewanella waksmanii TaxID=213783 RepID=UPI0004AF9867|nr:PLP-dependent aminotransferase family protein [Shewanella waksmanii]
MANFKYQQIVAQMISDIEAGTLQHKLPSVRSLAARKQCGVSTVVQAYHQLERLGWIEAKPKQGYFVLPKMAAETASTVPNYGRQINRVVAGLTLDAAVQYSFNDPSILPLSCTAPSTVLDLEVTLNRLHKAAIKQRPYQLWMQDPIEGVAPLRAGICQQLKLSGQFFNIDQVLITNGRQEGLLVALHAAKVLQSAIAVESPMSFYFQSMLKQLNAEVIEIPMQQDYDDELALLSAAHASKPFSGYLVNPNFADPTGRVLSETDKQKLIDWAIQHDVTLIEYDRGELYFGRHRPITLASLVASGSKCKLISIADFYDTVSPTISLGYLLCINTFAACQLTKQVLAEDPSIALQHMMQRMLETGDYAKHLVKLRQQIRLNYTRTMVILRPYLPQLSAAGVYVSQPEGGPCLWFRLPGGYSSEQFWHVVIAQKLAIAPGSMFSLANNYSGFFRITFALPWNDEMEQGIILFARLLAEFVGGNHSDINIDSAE